MNLQTTTQHPVIMAWSRLRSGRPYVLKSDGNILLKIHLSETATESLSEEIPWSSFFEIFESRKLAFQYQEVSEDGNTSVLNEFVERSTTIEAKVACEEVQNDLPQKPKEKRYWARPLF